LTCQCSSEFNELPTTYITVWCFNTSTLLFRDDQQECAILLTFHILGTTFRNSFVSWWNPSVICHWNCRYFLKTVWIQITELNFPARATGQGLNFTKLILYSNYVIWIFSFLHDVVKKHLNRCVLTFRTIMFLFL